MNDVLQPLPESSPTLHNFQQLHDSMNIYNDTYLLQSPECHDLETSNSGVLKHCHQPLQQYSNSQKQPLQRTPQEIFTIQYIFIGLDYIDGEMNLQRQNLAHWNKSNEQAKSYEYVEQLSSTKFPHFKNLYDASYHIPQHYQNFPDLEKDAAKFLHLKVKYEHISMLNGCNFKNLCIFAPTTPSTPAISRVDISTMVYSFGTRVLETIQSIDTVDWIRHYDFCKLFFDTFFNGIQLLNEHERRLAVDNLSVVQVIRNSNIESSENGVENLVLCVAWEFQVVNGARNAGIEVYDVVDMTTILH